MINPIITLIDNLSITTTKAQRGGTRFITLPSLPSLSIGNNKAISSGDRNSSTYRVLIRQMPKNKLLSFIVLLSATLIMQSCSVKPKWNDTTELKKLLDSGKITSEFAVQQAIMQAKEKSDLNVMIHLDEENALALAKEYDQLKSEGKSAGTLHGVPIVVKDNIHVKGMANTAGTPALANFNPTEDSPVVKKLRDAGAIVIGKSNMHELAFGISGYNYAFYENHIGVRNAYNRDRIAGGSSSGTGVAIGAGIVTAGLGSDTGGSVRIPAALNNACGYRPTIGRYSQAGVTPISHTRDTVGLMAKTVDDIILLDNVITNQQSEVSQAATIRLGVVQSFLANLSPEVKKLWDVAIKKIENTDIQIVIIEEDYEITALNQQVSFPIALYEASGDLKKYLQTHNIDLSAAELAEQIASPDVKGTYQGLVLPQKLPTPDNELVDAKPIYDNAMQNVRPQLIAAYQKLFDDNNLDGIIFPTTPVEAIVSNDESSSLENFLLYIQNTDPGSNAGMPGLSIPMGLTKDGLPAGLEIDALHHQDDKMLRIGKTLQGIID